MTCDQNDNLSAYHDGEMSPERAAQFEAHLAACEACRIGLAQLRRLSVSFAMAPKLELSAAARRRIEAALGVPAWVRLVLPVARPFAAAAVLLMAVGLPVLAINGGAHQAETASATAAVPAMWETTVVARDANTSDVTPAAQAQFADWVVADLSSARHR